MILSLASVVLLQIILLHTTNKDQMPAVKIGTDEEVVMVWTAAGTDIGGTPAFASGFCRCAADYSETSTDSVILPALSGLAQGGERMPYKGASSRALGKSLGKRPL